MVDVGEYGQMSMDGFVKNVLDTAKTVIRKDWDMVFIVDGSEGCGKSVFTMQCARYCDPTFCLERVVFTPKEFRQAIINAQPYQAVVYDEAYTGLSSRATMSLINRTLISMLAEIRQKNLFVFVVMPCFFDLDKYVALWRSRGLFHAYVGKNFERGFVAFYNSDKKKFLYINGKKFYSYGKPIANFIGRFTNKYVVDDKKYKEKKKDSLIAREKGRDEKQVKAEFQDLLFERLQAEDIKLKNTEKIKILNISERSYYRKLKKYQDGD
jgi:hypothetical protein